jgi:hypothetical protein
MQALRFGSGVAVADSWVRHATMRGGLAVMFREVA